MTPRRAGFTLVEILVSLLIFSLVSLAMFGILLASTNIFRFGEFGRASTDEGVSALSIIDEDVRRMVPGRDGGLFYSILHDPVVDPATGVQPPFPKSGDCAAAFMIYQANAGLVQGQNGNPSNEVAYQHGGGGARQLVLYYVEHPSAANVGTTSDVLPDDEILWRLQAPIIEDIPPSQFPNANLFPQPYVPPTDDVEFIEQLLNPAQRQVWLGSAPYLSAPSAVAKRVLHFGTWITNDQQQRAASGNWLVDSTAPTPQSIPPFNNQSGGALITTAYTTEADPTATAGGMASPTSAAASTAEIFPNAVLFTLALSVGRYAPKGIVVSDQGGTPEAIRVANIGALPLTQGSKVRIGTEWVAYDQYIGGVLSVEPSGRGALRSTALGTFPHGTLVQWGPMYSLARTFPH